jgi:hypothetical protein
MPPRDSETAPTRVSSTEQSFVTRKPVMTRGGFLIVPDARWPNMYRIRKPDGTLTDMVNLNARAGRARKVECNLSHEMRSV